jgi:hypothetical protein
MQKTKQKGVIKVWWGVEEILNIDCSCGIKINGKVGVGIEGEMLGSKQNEGRGGKHGSVSDCKSCNLR